MPKPSHLQALNSDSAPAALKVAASAGGASVESAPPPSKRRVFTAAEKLRIVRAAAACTERGSVEALLRREGIYSSLLASWRKQLGLHGTDGLAGHKPGRKAKMDAKDRRIAELEKQTAKLQAKLVLAGKLLDLQKKAASILGLNLASDEES